MLMRRKVGATRSIQWILLSVSAFVLAGCSQPDDAAGAVAQKESQTGSSDEDNNESQNDAVASQDKQPSRPGFPRNPFPRRIPFEYEFPADAQWLNTGGGRVRLADLKGKFVLLDFWTYCCINCIHVLPELKKAEQKYGNELVVIGVHSAKFDAEQDVNNISDAIQRYEIEHPVINDPNHEVWRSFDVSSWPTLYLIDPEGNLVWGRGGEVPFETLDRILGDGVAYYRGQGLIDESPLKFQLESRDREATPLRYPGKILADGKGRLYISDSNHNRIVVTSTDGEWIETIGSGRLGSQDGDFETAEFDHPQGMAIRGETLYVADTENHLIREVDLASRQVSTVAGVGRQGREAFTKLTGRARDQNSTIQLWGGLPKKTALNSPWALWIHADELYIAMAGPHQIWKMPLDGSVIGPFAGNGREDIVDGPLLPDTPYEEGFSSFAQPSGLASDGEWLFVADSEGSSIRAVPFDPDGSTKTVVGTADLPRGRLFDFGDVDGPREQVKLQHALGIVYAEGKLFIADTYNNKIKVVDPESGETVTLAGTGQPGASDSEGTFDEPAGLTFSDGKLFVADTNNHLIREVDTTTGAVKTFEIRGLTPPTLSTDTGRPSFAGAEQITIPAQPVAAVEGTVKLAVNLQFPPGWKINPLAPMGYYIQAAADGEVVDRSKLKSTPYRIEKPESEFEISLPVKAIGEDLVTISMNYFYCRGGSEGICKMGSVQWHVQLDVKDSAPGEPIVLDYEVIP